MKRIFIAIVILLLLAGKSYASPFEYVETDKVAHAAVSYVICDELQRHGMNAFWAATTSIALGAAKEKFIDNKWDPHDFTADCMGVMLCRARF